MLFPKTTDQTNYNNACKIAQRLFQFINMRGGIGVMTDQNTKVISYEFIIHLNEIHINFGSCLTSEELLAKTKLYRALFKDTNTDPNRMLEICMTKARNNPRFKAILQDLIIVSEFIKHQNQGNSSPLLSQAIH